MGGWGWRFDATTNDILGYHIIFQITKYKIMVEFLIRYAGVTWAHLYAVQTIQLQPFAKRMAVTVGFHQIRKS